MPAVAFKGNIVVFVQCHLQLETSVLFSYFLDVVINVSSENRKRGREIFIFTGNVGTCYEGIINCKTSSSAPYLASVF